MENFDLPFSADDAGRIYESVSASLSSVESKLGQVVREVRVGIADGLSAGDNGPLLKSYGDIKGAVEFQLADARSALDQATASINPADIVPSEAAPKLVDALSPAFGALAALPTSLQFGAGLVASFFIFNSLLGGPPLDSPYPAGVYDARTATQYFRTRPLTQLIRVAEIMFLSSSFLFSVYVLDKLFSSPENAEELEEKRGVELADLLTVLGPTFIKVGQSLSIRTDLVQASYAKGLTQLQDKVPPFNSEEAFKILSAQFNKPVDEVFSTITPEPIASASLGQVYKATMRESGQQVAVKIQRPRSVEKIALDMHLVRTFAAPLKAAFNINTDLVGTVDAWGGGFVDELDYLKESENAKVFNEAIKTTTLSNVVFAPAPLDSYCTTNILTTEWIDGERLDKSSKDDVSSLCSVAMNTYLAMMLELGVLHCDPHPGNLLRTPEGKLCILDWGLVTSLSSDLQITLIEHVAHLTSGDYAEVPEDLVLLGFVPEKMVERMKEAKIVETLADIYGTWSMGGGANRIDVNSVVNDIRGLTAKGEGSIFQVPPYFFYIGKAFSVLEGIGLQNDENYSVINACLPYISKRLLQDKSDRMAGALDSFIFGEGKNSRDRVIDVDRMGQLVTGFGDYSATSSNELTSSRSQILEDQAEQLIEIVLTDDSPINDVIFEQLAKVIGATTRKGFVSLREQSGLTSNGQRSLLGFALDPLGLFKASSLTNTDKTDEVVLESSRKVLKLAEGLGAHNFDGLTDDETRQLVAKCGQTILAHRERIPRAATKLLALLVTQTADRLESRVEVKRTIVPPHAEHVATATTPSSLSVIPREEGKEDESDRLKKARAKLSLLDTY